MDAHQPNPAATGFSPYPGIPTAPDTLEASFRITDFSNWVRDGRQSCLVLRRIAPYRLSVRRYLLKWTYLSHEACCALYILPITM
jgi:hypothetical protein